jgi:hypothetical protein
VIEVYAIAEHPGPPLPDVAPLAAARADGLAAVYAPAGEAEPTADALWRHQEIVEALMEERDLLPVRYGTRLRDPEEAARAVAARHDELAAALDRVRGAVELSLRVVAIGDRAPLPEPNGANVSGREYLRAKVRHAATREEVSRRVHEPLSREARGSTVLSSRTPNELLRAAYLVDRDAVDDLAEHVARLQRSEPRLRILCTGPWPPYSFVPR